MLSRVFSRAFSRLRDLLLLGGIIEGNGAHPSVPE